MVRSTGEPEYRHRELTKRIIGHFYDVYNLLGYGFLEKMYKATKYEVGLLLNFGASPKVTRKAFDNYRKKLLQKPQ